MGRWDRWGHLKYFLMRKLKDRTSSDFWASRGAVYMFVCVCARACVCVYKYTPCFPVQKSWLLPYLGRRVAALTWKKGYPARKGGGVGLL